MAKLEEITPGASVVGIVPQEPVTVISTTWHGGSAIQVTVRLTSGRVEEQMLFRGDEARLVASATFKPWAFDSPGDAFRLVSKAHRINLAALFDPLLAVQRPSSSRFRTRSWRCTTACSPGNLPTAPWDLRESGCVQPLTTSPTLNRDGGCRRPRRAKRELENASVPNLPL